MKNLELIHKISELFSIFVTNVKGLNALFLYDINIISENILIPIFKEIFQLPDLKNVNEDKKNYPGIDLADDKKKVAFQVTATRSSKKINDTLQQFFKYELEDRYSQLYCYILTEKQNSYTIKNKDLEGSNFEFLPDRDILDYTDILKKIQTFEIKIIEKIKAILEEQFPVIERLKSLRQNNASDDSDPWKSKLVNNETLCSNLLEITFPKKLYMGSLDFDRKEVLKASRHEGGSFLKNTASMRQVAREALHQKPIIFAPLFTIKLVKLCHGN